MKNNLMGSPGGQSGEKIFREIGKIIGKKRDKKPAETLGRKLGNY